MFNISDKTKKYTEWTFLALAVLVVAFFLFPYAPIEGNYQLKTVLSGSMEPAIKIGSVVVVKPARTYKEGDIIGYKRPGAEKPTSHRIHDIRQENGETVFITKGDANEDPDPAPVKKEWVIGKIHFSIPYLGYLAKWAQTKTGFLVLIFVPAAVIIGDQIKNICDEIKKKRSAVDSPQSTEEEED